MARYTAAFGRHGIGVGQVLLTAEDVIRRTHYVNARRTLYRLLQLGVVPVVNENDTVATDEIRFGDNDRLAALVAHLVHADALVLLTDVDGLYDRAPSKPGARRVDVVTGPQDLAEVSLGTPGSRIGTGGMVTKVEAASIATTAGIATVLTSAAQVAHGAGRGRTSAPGSRRPARGGPAGCSGWRTRAWPAGPARAGRRRGRGGGRAPHVAASGGIGVASKGTSTPEIR